ncbi:hypothetical protein [Streptomyces sp. NPDC048577]|uniref:hypothetical protein n=1 Tax=Streptomyces sp. NPDC048577 TaxID=3157209 RepID=UPI003418B858
MGSLRNPVGPLPSSIYWRRRAVALCLIVLLALLGLWAVTSGGGGGKKPDDGVNGASPAPSITPGPSGSGTAISEQPGGRDESGDSGGGTGGASGGGTDGGTGDGAATGGGGKNGDTDGGGADGGAGAPAGQRVPADSPLPNCAPGALQLTLKSTKLSYGPGEKPGFRLVVRNASATDCKADFGPRSAVLKISDEEGDAVWSSRDCPRPGDPVLLRVPARTSITHTVAWDRARSAPQCAATPAGPVDPGTYLAEATLPGTKVSPASFTLAKD